MAPKTDPDEKDPTPAGSAPDRLDAPDPAVDPRFRFTVSAPPLTYVASKQAGWDGALLVEGDSGFVRSAEARHEHEALMIQRWQTPHLARPIGRPGGWATFSPGVKLCLPGDREYGEWCGRPRVQSVFVAPERVEAVLGAPWEGSGLTRWRDPRHASPFVDHVVSALMQDMEAGHPAGPITGDSLLVALLLHLDAAGTAAASPRRGALGRRLDAVRDYIEAHLAHPIQLAELEAVADVDVKRLGAIFAAEMGCSPQRYVLHRRIERAKLLIRDPDLTLAQIARAVGFANADQFSRVFRQITGTPPGAYRRH